MNRPDADNAHYRSAHALRQSRRGFKLIGPESHASKRAALTPIPKTSTLLRDSSMPINYEKASRATVAFEDDLKWHQLDRLTDWSGSLRRAS